MRRCMFGRSFVSFRLPVSFGVCLLRTREILSLHRKNDVNKSDDDNDKGSSLLLLLRILCKLCIGTAESNTDELNKWMRSIQTWGKKQIELEIFFCSTCHDALITRSRERWMVRFLCAVDGLVQRIMHNILVAYYKFMRCDGARHWYAISDHITLASSSSSDEYWVPDAFHPVRTITTFFTGAFIPSFFKSNIFLWLFRRKNDSASFWLFRWMATKIFHENWSLGAYQIGTQRHKKILRIDGVFV